MSLMRLLGFRNGQALVAVALLALAYASQPQLFDSEFALLLVVPAYLAAYYVHFAIRRYVFRRAVAFDFGGVLVTGNYDTDKLHECPGMRQLLKELREKYVIAILSNNNELFRHGMEKRFGFDSLFDEVIFSSRVGSKKPDPHAFHYLLRRFGMGASQVVFVDDTLENVEAAKKLGMHGVQFNCNTQNITQLRSALRNAGVSI